MRTPDEIDVTEAVGAPVDPDADDVPTAGFTADKAPENDELRADRASIVRLDACEIDPFDDVPRCEDVHLAELETIRTLWADAIAAELEPGMIRAVLPIEDVYYWATGTVEPESIMLVDPVDDESDGERLYFDGARLRLLCRWTRPDAIGIRERRAPSVLFRDGEAVAALVPMKPPAERPRPES